MSVPDDELLQLRNMMDHAVVVTDAATMLLKRCLPVGTQVIVSGRWRGTVECYAAPVNGCIIVKPCDPVAAMPWIGSGDMACVHLSAIERVRGTLDQNEDSL